MQHVMSAARPDVIRHKRTHSEDTKRNEDEINDFLIKNVPGKQFWSPAWHFLTKNVPGKQFWLPTMLKVSDQSEIDSIDWCRKRKWLNSCVPKKTTKKPENNVTKVTKVKPANKVTKLKGLCRIVLRQRELCSLYLGQDKDICMQKRKD